MATSETEICNMALAQLGVSITINSLTERSKEAKACNQFYATARDKVLRDFPWPFARRIVDLALVSSTLDEWSFAYRYPADCVFARRIINGVSRRRTRDTDIPFELASDASGQLIYTDREDATLEYTALITDVSRFSADFVTFLQFLIAGLIGPRVTGGDKFQLANRALQFYDLTLRQARQNAFNEQQPDTDAPSSLELARGSSGAMDWPTKIIR